MKTRRMMAVKPHKYGTRHLTAGEEYDVPDLVARWRAMRPSWARAGAAPRPPATRRKRGSAYVAFGALQPKRKALRLRLNDVVGIAINAWCVRCAPQREIRSCRATPIRQASPDSFTGEMRAAPEPVWKPAAAGIRYPRAGVAGTSPSAVHYLVVASRRLRQNADRARYRPPREARSARTTSV